MIIVFGYLNILVSNFVIISVKIKAIIVEATISNEAIVIRLLVIKSYYLLAFGG